MTHCTATVTNMVVDQPQGLKLDHVCRMSGKACQKDGSPVAALPSVAALPAALPGLPPSSTSACCS